MSVNQSAFNRHKGPCVVIYNVSRIEKGCIRKVSRFLARRRTFLFSAKKKGSRINPKSKNSADSPAAKVPGARASRYRVYGVIELHIGIYPEISAELAMSLT